VLEYKFKITPQILDHLALSVDVQRQNSVEIPYAKQHKGWELAENRWGDIVGSSRKRNSKGKDALYLHVKFSDEEAKKVGLRSNVSVGVPPLSYDGLGRRYTNPLRHLAATSAPVVPGLDPWQAIAASFESPDFEPIIGDLAMPFPPKKKPTEGEGDEGKKPFGKPAEGEEGEQEEGSEQIPKSDGQPSGSQGQQETNIFDQILGVLELVVPPDADDNAKGVAILTALQMLKGKRQMNQQQQQQTPQQQQNTYGKNMPGAQASPGGGIQLSQENSPLILDTIAKNRELQLSQLVSNEILDVNAAKELHKLFGSRQQIGLELSQGSDGAQFNKLLGILANNKPVIKSGRSETGLGELEIELGHDGENKGLAKAVDKRVEEAKK
jgi:hypothetical protein